MPRPILAESPEFSDPEKFEQYRKQVDRGTENRVREGERESRVYYILQSAFFTTVNPIEPAVLAGKWTAGEAIPPAVQGRMNDFLRTCKKPPVDERFRYFCGLDAGSDQWERDFSRAMKFLREKEHESSMRDGDERREFVASLYRNRGLSSDSGFDANFPVYLALRTLAAKPGREQLNKVLIVGPGLEFAPRTGLRDSIPPQSVQPFAVMDALLQLGLASRESLSIHCVDVNPRVTGYFQRERSGSLPLTIFQHDGPDEYVRYYETFGNFVGTGSTIEGHSKTIQIPAKTANAIRGSLLNIVTQREQPSPRYDLVIATNVLLYLGDPELSLALTNIQYMLREGGYFLHNELRAGVERIGPAIEMPVVDARLIRIRQDDRRAIFDSLVVQRKRIVP